MRYGLNSTVGLVITGIKRKCVSMGLLHVSGLLWAWSHFLVSPAMKHTG
jgi:hypothetical protein